jgi:Flp pilus assembly protein TadG
MVCRDSSNPRKSRTAFSPLISAFRDRRGVSAVEFAILAPVLVALPVPIVDIGLGLYTQMELQNAAQAGAQYALLHPSAFPSPAQIQAAAVAAVPSLTLTASSSQACGCPGTGPAGAPAVTFGSCGTACSTGQPPGTFITVTAQTTYVPMMSYPALGNSVALSAHSVARIQ